ncbi:DUF371 domain-containing protein [Candidatus Bathyarchaeota archaeon]|nr:DUF371 domain-containing protein [Candidatus Bathyarchaeota archaeon]
MEEIRAFGHSLVRATHKTTFEVTREDHLTERGDCIIAVKADKAARDLSERFRDIARRPNAEIIIIIEANGERDVVRAYGSPRLTLTHSMDIVVRKSSYVCARTVAIGADKAACNLSRKLIEKLRNPHQEVRIILSARA